MTADITAKVKCMEQVYVNPYYLKPRPKRPIALQGNYYLFKR